VFAVKRRAMEALAGQQHMWEYYTALARRRGDGCGRTRLASFGVATVHDLISATRVRKSAGAVDGFQGPAKFLRGAAALMVCGPRRGGNVTIRSLRLVLALTEIGGEPRSRALCEKLPACAGPLLLYAQEIEPHAGWHLGNFPRPSRTWRSFNACVH